MYSDEDDSDSIICSSLRLDTSVVRVIDHLFLPAKLRIRVDFSPEFVAQTVAGTKAIMKIRYWIDNIFKHSILISSSNNTAFKMLYASAEGRASNNMVMVPGDPIDSLLSIVLQAKFEALAEMPEIINFIEVKSDNTFGVVTTFIGEPSDYLPPMEQWVGDRSFFDTPWWNRDDISTYDLVPTEDADLTKRPAHAAKIAMPMFEEDDGSEGDAAETAEIAPSTIIRPSFRPRVIDGGKKPEPDA